MYIWAREHPEFKYQQGMNEILATVVGVVFSEISNKSTTEDNESEDDFYDEFAPENVAHFLHDEKFAWADVYSLYERILDLGIKDLYYKELDDSSSKKTETIQKQQTQREKKKAKLEEQAKEN